VQLTHAPGDQLRVLRAEIEDEDQEITVTGATATYSSR